MVDNSDVQIKLSFSNFENLKRFIAESKKLDPEYSMKPTVIFNMMGGEKLREELKRFEKADCEIHYQGQKPSKFGPLLKRLERKKP